MGEASGRRCRHPDEFACNSALVQEFYNARRRQLQSEITPNSAHLAMAELEQMLS
ncbi:hypothetical protein [Sodalis sp.]|uniref:hypothetical protein n=1 Tax=Sodalis sp. (in: enterobacteria) TaxID=1898979 RepID=UPI0038738D60